MMFPKVSQSPETDTFGLEYLNGLYSYALMLTRNRPESEDLVQETYVRAMQARERLREDSNVKGWLFTILRNLWLNQLRKRKNGPTLVEIDGEDGGAGHLPGNSRDSHELLVGKEDAERVRSAIEELSVEFREVIVLREFEELSYQEIASVLDCPLGTVMSRLGRARAKLRVLLAPAPAQLIGSGRESRS